MKKKYKKLIIAVAVLLILVMTLLLVKNLVKEDEEETPTTETYDVVTISAEDLSSVKLTIKETVTVSSSDDAETDSSAVDSSAVASSAVSSGSTYVIKNMIFSVKEDKSGWVWSEDENVPVLNDVFADMVTELDEATSTIKLTDVSAEKLGEFGLADPYIVATFGYDDGTESTFNVGKMNGYNSQYYFSDAAAPTTVYMVDSTVVSTLNITVYDALDWDDAPSIAAAKIQGLTFETANHIYNYKYYANGNDNDYTDNYNWYLSIDGGVEFPVASSLATGLTTSLTSFSFEDCVHFTGAIPADYSLTGSGSIKMTALYSETETVIDSETSAETTITKDASYVITLGAQDADGYFYCKPTDSQLVYLLTYSEVVSSALSEDENDIRPTELLNLNMERVDGVKLVASGSVLDVSITHDVESTTYADASGADFDSAKFTAIMDKLGEITAASSTSALEPVSSSGNDVIFSATFRFNAGTTSSAVLEIRNYSENYRQVSFMGRNGQLITAADANALIDLVDAYFKKEA